MQPQHKRHKSPGYPATPISDQSTEHSRPATTASSRGITPVHPNQLSSGSEFPAAQITTSPPSLAGTPSYSGDPLSMPTDEFINQSSPNLYVEYQVGHTLFIHKFVSFYIIIL